MERYKFIMKFDRKTYEYRKWRRDVLNKDGNRCTKCGSAHNLEAHHVLPVALFPEDALKVYNGITLCRKCHYEVHNRNYGEDKVIACHISIHPIFEGIRKVTYYISYRTNIIKKFCKEFPLPRKFKRWLYDIAASFLLLAGYLIMSRLFS